VATLIRATCVFPTKAPSFIRVLAQGPIITACNAEFLRSTAFATALN
jgi:hypothetical protein